MLGINSQSSISRKQQHLKLTLWIASIALILVQNEVAGQSTALSSVGGRVRGVGGGGSSSGEYGPPGGSPGSVVGSGNAEILVPKTLPISAQEPTCEELRAMWRFSKRQSRAAEMTNELPTYRDPFAYNIWEPFISTTRSIGGMRIAPRYRDAVRPVYGRVIHREPIATFVDRNRVLEDFSRMYGTDGAKGPATESRRRSKFRFGSGGSSAQNMLTSHHGSFQRLKELIWTERAKELAAQRKAEELAARVAVLKDISNGQNFALQHQPQQQQHQQHHASSQLTDENRSPNTDYPTGTVSVLPSTGQKSSSSGSSFASSLRSGGVLLPLSSANGGQSSRTYTYGQPTSIFRERNRNLFRQDTKQPRSLVQSPGQTLMETVVKRKIANLIEKFVLYGRQKGFGSNGNFSANEKESTSPITPASSSGGEYYQRGLRSNYNENFNENDVDDDVTDDNVDERLLEIFQPIPRQHRLRQESDSQYYDQINPEQIDDLLDLIY